MKKINYLLLFAMFLAFFAMQSNSSAQVEPVLYFCDRYDDYEGEIGVKDRFSKGPVTVMVKCEDPLYMTNVTIQYDRYNFRSGKYDFYKSFEFDIERDMNYIFFSPTSGNDMRFDDSGFYRVFLLDEDGKTVASALIEIIP